MSHDKVLELRTQGRVRRRWYFRDALEHLIGYWRVGKTQKVNPCEVNENRRINAEVRSGPLIEFLHVGVGVRLS
jgi:hypothetical protein